MTPHPITIVISLPVQVGFLIVLLLLGVIVSKRHILIPPYLHWTYLVLTMMIWINIAFGVLTDWLAKAC
jgi:hypothetical protein